MKLCGFPETESHISLVSIAALRANFLFPHQIFSIASCMLAINKILFSLSFKCIIAFLE